MMDAEDIDSDLDQEELDDGHRGLSQDSRPPM